MKERGIIFQGWGVRAIRNMKPGVWPAEAIDPSKPIKWQTRRLVTEKQLARFNRIDPGHQGFDEMAAAWAEYATSKDPMTADALALRAALWAICPHGVPGDGLWVREAWGTHDDLSNEDQNQVYYKADWGKPNPEWAMMPKLRLKPSIHMFRWASREDLVVKEVRVERVQEISEEDAKTEGIRFDGTYWLGGTHPVKGTWQCWATARRAFQAIWDEINKARGVGWEANPRVWAVSYMRKAK